jgi:hypothetical protein
MRRPLDTRLARAEGRRTVAAAEQGAAAIRQRIAWRAEAEMGMFIRDALVRAGIDPAQAVRLRLADEAAATLVALPDTPELQRADSDGSAAAEAHSRGQGDAFTTKILTMAQSFAGASPPDLAKASFAELYPGPSPRHNPSNPLFSFPTPFGRTAFEIRARSSCIANFAAGTPPLRRVFPALMAGALDVDDCRGAAAYRAVLDRADAGGVARGRI